MAWGASCGELVLPLGRGASASSGNGWGTGFQLSPTFGLLGNLSLLLQGKEGDLPLLLGPWQLHANPFPGRSAPVPTTGCADTVLERLGRFACCRRAVWRPPRRQKKCLGFPTSRRHSSTSPAAGSVLHPRLSPRNPRRPGHSCTLPTSGDFSCSYSHFG